MKPETRARISTVSTAVTRPFYSSHSVIIFSSGCETVTGGGVGDALPPTDLLSQPARIAVSAIARAKGAIVLINDAIDSFSLCCRSPPVREECTNRVASQSIQ